MIFIYPFKCFTYQCVHMLRFYLRQYIFQLIIFRRWSIVEFSSREGVHLLPHCGRLSVRFMGEVYFYHFLYVLKKFHQSKARRRIKNIPVTRSFCLSVHPSDSAHATPDFFDFLTLHNSPSPGRINSAALSPFFTRRITSRHTSYADIF